MSLWVIPPPGKSAWFAKIDWYLNWQMIRGLAHESQRPSTELLRLAREHGLPEPILSSTTRTPLMIAARGRLGTDQCVVLEMSDSVADWLKLVHDLTVKLGSAKTRVYLPSGTSRAKAQELWKNITAKDKFDKEEFAIEFLADEEAASWSTQFQKN